MNDFCRRCALTVGMLTALGGCQAPKHHEVLQARRAMCLAAVSDRATDDDFLRAAIGLYDNYAAMGTAMGDYLAHRWNEGECVPAIEPGRIGELLHQHSESDPS